MEEYIKQDPESGHVFAFFSRNKKLVKLLQWEDGGFVIWMKRLEQGGFHIPQSADGRIELTSRELAAILSGIKPQRYYKSMRPASPMVMVDRGEIFSKGEMATK